MTTHVAPAVTHDIGPSGEAVSADGLHVTTNDDVHAQRVTWHEYWEQHWEQFDDRVEVWMPVMRQGSWGLYSAPGQHGIGSFFSLPTQYADVARDVGALFFRDGLLMVRTAMRTYAWRLDSIDVQASMAGVVICAPGENHVHLYGNCAGAVVGAVRAHGRTPTLV